MTYHREKYLFNMFILAMLSIKEKRVLLQQAVMCEASPPYCLKSSLALLLHVVKPYDIPQGKIFI
jgi:hypothetical protein